jgi:hypothetical protein
MSTCAGNAIATHKVHKDLSGELVQSGGSFKGYKLQATGLTSGNHTQVYIGT